MPTLKGKWYFKENIDWLDIGDAALQFTVTNESGEIFYADGMSIDLDMPVLTFIGSQQQPSISGEVYVDESWQVDFVRTINIGYPQEVSEEFYNWFTKNAVDLQPTGTWRFNKTINFPETALHMSRTEGFATSLGEDMWDLYVSTNLIYGLGAGNDRLINILTNGQWEHEDARIITFTNKLDYLYPEFALWFYENAHSMELKLYSECYIAEAVDTIRKHTGDTKGYTVKDLAVGIDKVAAKNANFGTWTFKDRLWDLGLGNYISEHGTTNKIDPNLIAPVVVFNVKFSTSAKIEASGTANSDMTETSEFVAMEFPHAINANSSISYYTSVDYSSGDCFRACVATPGNTDFYEGYEAAKTIILREEPSEELLDFLNTFATKVGGVALPALSNPATTGDVLAGKEYIDASGNKKVGTIPEITPTLDGIDYYGVNYVNDDNKLVLQLGYHQPSGGYMAAGADSHDGPVITDIPASSGVRVVPGTTDKVAVNAGYYVWSDAVVAGDSNLIASNIKKDTTIFGITGTYEGATSEELVTVHSGGTAGMTSSLGEDGDIYLVTG
jgi:hypothetical protein